MKTRNIGKFFKKYGFYIAASIISIGALTAISIFPNRKGNVANEANPYAQNRAADSAVEDSLEADASKKTKKETNQEVTDSNTQSIHTADDQEAINQTVENQMTKAENDAQDKLAQSDEAKSEDDAVTQTFESTTNTVATEPFFATGDTFTWPVEGEVVVPYTDENTKYWYSDSLNQTMRTFGICISGKEGEAVKAVADGKVLKVVEDSNLLNADLPYVGNAMVIDHGNGYMTIYGFQKGNPDKELVGKMVKAGDTLGTIGSPSGAFISKGDNIYLQVMHNEENISPLTLLDTEDAKMAESVDTMSVNK